jgi:hypothetical protein
MYCFRENSNFPFSNQKIITLVRIWQWDYEKWNGLVNGHKTVTYILTKSLSVWDISSGSTDFICCKQCVSCTPNCEKVVWRTLMTTISSSLNMSYKHKINKLSTKHFAKKKFVKRIFFYMYNVHVCIYVHQVKRQDSHLNGVECLFNNKISFFWAHLSHRLIWAFLVE